jgi:hypothetical protein
MHFYPRNRSPTIHYSLILEIEGAPYICHNPLFNGTIPMLCKARGCIRLYACRNVSLVHKCMNLALVLGQNCATRHAATARVTQGALSLRKECTCFVHMSDHSALVLLANFFTWLRRFKGQFSSCFPVHANISQGCELSCSIQSVLLASMSRPWLSKSRKR